MHVELLLQLLPQHNPVLCFMAYLHADRADPKSQSLTMRWPLTMLIRQFADLTSLCHTEFLCRNLVQGEQAVDVVSLTLLYLSNLRSKSLVVLSRLKQQLLLLQ